MTDKPEINEVAKALSDEFRVKILSILLGETPKRYSDLLHLLEPENETDSGKLAYHLKILSNAGLIVKNNESYRVTEMGCQVYSAMETTTDVWDKLVLRENLKHLTVWEVLYLLWSDSLSVGIIFVVIGLTTFLQKGGWTYALLGIIGVVLMISWRIKYPSVEGDKKEVVKELKTLLGDNRLLPELVNIHGVFSLIILLGYGMFIYTNAIVLDTLFLVLMIECVLGVGIAYWLTLKMKEIWSCFQMGIVPVSYQETLSMISSYTLQFNMLFSIMFLARLFSHSQYRSHLWLPINLLIASYNLFKDTLPTE